MSACGIQLFSNVTPAVWNCLVQKAAGYNIAITTPSGQQTKDGFTFKWDYNAGGNSLSIQCLDSPWWATCGMINGKVHDIVDSCLSART